MTITHHLDDATLMSFAAGSLPATLSVVAASRYGFRFVTGSRGRIAARLAAALLARVVVSCRPASAGRPRSARA